MKLVRPFGEDGDNLRVPLPRLAAKHIQEKIDAGVFTVGDRLPAQREFANDMGISRTVLREAITMLEASGILRTEAGSGTYVAERKPKREDMVAGDAIGLAGRYAKLDISRLRYVMESYCARLAAMRVTDADIQRLNSNLTSFKEQVRLGDFEQSARTDEAFHHLIVEIAAVPLFVDFHSSFRQMLLETLTMPVEVHSRCWEPVVEHERILVALERRDPDEASYYMQSHITRSAERLGYVQADEVL